MADLRVLHWVDEWLPQTQPWIYNQVRHLPDDVESHVACRTTRHLDQFPFHRIHALQDEPLTRQLVDRGLRFLGIRHHLDFLRRRIQALRPDILHSHFGHAGWYNLGAARGTDTRHVVTFYGQDLSWRPVARPEWRSRYRDLFREADLFLCEGPHMARGLSGLGCAEGRIALQRLGVDLSRIPYDPRRWSPGDTLRVLMAASFREKKGIPYGIRALGRLRGSRPLELTVVGDATSQPGSAREKRRILEAVKEAGLDPVTRFLGFLSHDALLAEAFAHHVFLSPSVTASDGDAEGGAPVSLIEMAASGMPIVTTRHCDIPEVVVDGVNAELASERDEDGLVEALHALLDAHEEWPSRLMAGRRHVEDRFDASAQGAALGARYRDLAGAQATS